MRKLNIALTKGRIEKQAVKIFKNVGIDVANLENKGRKLIISCKNEFYDVNFFLVKAFDVTTYVEQGSADIGIVGKDTLMESTKDIYEILDLGIGKCKFVLASLPTFDINSGVKKKKIATKYPNVAKEYFIKKGIDIQLIKIDGSVELAPLVGLADGIVDIVETGTTLRENGLVVMEEICDVSTKMIVNKTSLKLKKQEIMGLIKEISKQI